MNVLSFCLAQNSLRASELLLETLKFWTSSTLSVSFLVTSQDSFLSHKETVILILLLLGVCGPFCSYRSLGKRSELCQGWKQVSLPSSSLPFLISLLWSLAGSAFSMRFSVLKSESFGANHKLFLGRKRLQILFSMEVNEGVWEIFYGVELAFFFPTFAAWLVILGVQTTLW